MKTKDNNEDQTPSAACDSGWIDELSEGTELTAETERSFLKRLNKNIAKSVEASVKEITDFSLGRDAATIGNIRFEKHEMLVSICIPFSIVPNSMEPSHPVKEQKHIRREFALYIRNNSKRLSSLLHTMLLEVLLDKWLSKEKLHLDISKNLKSIAQRSLAGRPTLRIPPRYETYIQNEGKEIKNAISKIRDVTRSMKKDNKDLTIADVWKKLRRKYPRSKYPWMAHFKEISAKLPRRRYLASAIKPEELLENTDRNSGPCDLLEPENWLILDAAARVVQLELKAIAKIVYPFGSIKELLLRRKRKSTHK
jgi:hypothetical protein